MLKTILRCVGLSLLLMVLWLALLSLLGAAVSFLFKSPPGLLVVSEFSAASILSSLVFARLLKQQAWAGRLVSNFPAKGVMLGFAGGTLVIGCAIALAMPFSYVLACTRCGSVEQYAPIFGQGFLAGGLEQIWNSATFLTALILLCNGRILIATFLAAWFFMLLHSHDMRADSWHVWRFVLAGFVMAQMTIWFESVWPAAAFHGALNGFIGIALEGRSPVNPLFATAPDGPALLEMIPLGILLAVFLYLNHARKRAEAKAPGAGSAVTAVPS